LFRPYCYAFKPPWPVIMGFVLDDWIYHRILCKISRSHNQLQELTVTLQLNPSSLTRPILVLVLQLTSVKVTLRLAVYRQSVRLGDKPPENHDTVILFSNRISAVVFLIQHPSDERMGPRQRSHSQLRIPRDSLPHFTVSDSRLPQSGGPGSRIYVPQEQGGPVIAPSTGFPFRRLLRLATLRWRYSNPPPHAGMQLQGNSQNSVDHCALTPLHIFIVISK
jgi:hypothetical protein